MHRRNTILKTIICRVCEKEKPYDDFPNRSAVTNEKDTTCKECGKKYYRIYYKTHKEEQSKKRKGYFKKYNSSKIAKDRKRNYKKTVKARLVNNLRTRIHHALKGLTKSKKTLQLIGCTVEQLKYHLEKHFKEGMTWDNYGSGINGRGMKEWHVDHIKPCASFDLSKPEEQRKCFHYSNLQPLWATENIKKRCS